MLKTLIASKIKEGGESLTIDKSCRDLIVNKCMDLVDDEFVDQLNNCINDYVDTIIKETIAAYIEEKTIVKFDNNRGAGFGIRTNFEESNEELLSMVVKLGDMIIFEDVDGSRDIGKVIISNPNQTIVETNNSKVDMKNKCILKVFHL